MTNDILAGSQLCWDREGPGAIGSDQSADCRPRSVSVEPRFVHLEPNRTTAICSSAGDRSSKRLARYVRCAGEPRCDVLPARNLGHVRDDRLRDVETVSISSTPEYKSEVTDPKVAVGPFGPLQKHLRSCSGRGVNGRRLRSDDASSAISAVVWHHLVSFLASNARGVALSTHPLHCTSMSVMSVIGPFPGTARMILCGTGL